MINPTGYSQDGLKVSHRISLLKQKGWRLYGPNNKKNPCFGEAPVWAFVAPTNLPMNERLKLLAYSESKQECVRLAFKKYQRLKYAALKATQND
jgi:hypothetical protein